MTDFPRSTNTSDLRSFLGLAQQLGAFIPDLSHMLSRMRLLLKKGTAWVWLSEHEDDFILVKKTLTSEKTMVKPFDADLQTILLTDASRLYGIGYCLVQQTADGHLSLIQCGSCSLTGTQQRYATIELECMAIPASGRNRRSFFLQRRRSHQNRRHRANFPHTSEIIADSRP